MTPKKNPPLGDRYVSTALLALTLSGGVWIVMGVHVFGFFRARLAYFTET